MRENLNKAIKIMLLQTLSKQVQRQTKLGVKAIRQGTEEQAIKLLKSERDRQKQAAAKVITTAVIAIVSLKTGTDNNEA